MTTASRHVLEGVPRTHFYEGGPECPEDIIFPSVLRACLRFLGDDLGCRHVPRTGESWGLECGYSYLLGTSGAAFFLSWAPGWALDNVALHYMSEDPAAPYRHALDSVGREYEIVQKEPGRDNEAEFRRRIIESLRDHGRPVLAFGVVGPPEPSLIAGYDDDGEVLIGWSFFQGFPEFAAGLEFEPSGYFRKRDWIEDTVSLIVLGEKLERPDLGKVALRALRWALQVARTPVTYGHRHNGLAAYQAWADHLLHDEAFATDDEAVLQQRHRVHDDAVGTVAEARWYGNLFLRQMTEKVHYNLVEDLLMAAARYAGEHELMWRVWDLAGGNGNPEAWVKLADPAVRRQMVPIILEARDKDADAAASLERALGKTSS